jgi:hypothetical protein
MQEDHKDPRSPQPNEQQEPVAPPEEEAPDADNKLDDYVKMMMRLRGGGARPILCW